VKKYEKIFKFSYKQAKEDTDKIRNYYIQAGILLEKARIKQKERAAEIRKEAANFGIDVELACYEELRRMKDTQAEYAASIESIKKGYF
jgi:hypothetical protein